MHTNSVSFIVALCLAAGTLANAEPARKNTYYSQWSNGVPDDSTFFPVAVWYQPTSRVADYKAAGVNMYIGPSVNSTSALDAFAALGGMYTITHYSATLRNATNNQVVVGWMHGDEPDNGTIDNGEGGLTCQDPEDLQDDYATWTGYDATRPVYLNLGKGVAYTSAGLRGDCSGATWMYPEYIDACDIVSFDIYPVTDNDVTVQGNLWYVPKGIDSLRMWSGYEKPAWCWIECSHIQSDVMPTPEETRSEVWMAIVHEASGIGYFCHEWVPSFSETAWLSRYPEMTTMITRTNQEIAAMAPALNSPTVHDAVSAETSWRNYLKTMTKVQGGYTYVYAVFHRSRSDSVTFTVNGLSGSTTAEVVGEDRSVSVTDGVFGDNFDEYGCHIYKIPGAAVSSVGDPAAAARRLERTVQVLNPAGNTFTLRKHEDLKGTDITVTLYAADGTGMDQAVSSGAEPVLELELAGYAPGMYHAVVEADGVRIVKSFIIAR